MDNELKLVKLKDSDGKIVAVLEVENFDEHSVTGNCYKCEQLDSVDDAGDLEDCKFLAEVYLKADSMTHWWFRGESFDTTEQDGRQDSYYCMGSSGDFLEHIRTLCFVWKVAYTLMLSSMATDSGREKLAKGYAGDAAVTSLIDTILGGYIIEYFQTVRHH